MVAAQGRRVAGAVGQLTVYGKIERIVGESFRILLEGQPLDGVARVVEHVTARQSGEELHYIDIDLFDASQRDIDHIRSMKSLSDTGTNFVRIGVANYDPDAPPDEQAVAFELMGEAPREYEGMVLHTVTVRKISEGAAHAQIKAVQMFKANKEVSP